MTADEARPQPHGADEDDHDLLTFNESGTRLQQEVRAIEDAVAQCADPDERSRLETRRSALQAALERISQDAEARPGETGFLNYRPPSR
ncbi:hypothetical protein LRP67_03055 [Nocardioides sp. cx-169]|uniref:hypothetical protein n=1 Tax=Nocardioides sp. cx-169 TaxID=2899080 RepID=UPI001E5325F1|nr:hypothetical protein [Nocardioides sp. cx-169]MCD4533058.1 hypothetical protein [Nocardioides sp. cx-169]